MNNLLQQRQQLMQQTERANQQNIYQQQQENANWARVGSAVGGTIADGIAKRSDGINDNGTISVSVNPSGDAATQGLIGSLPSFDPDELATGNTISISGEPYQITAYGKSNPLAPYADKYLRYISALSNLKGGF